MRIPDGGRHVSGNDRWQRGVQGRIVRVLGPRGGGNKTKEGTAGVLKPGPKPDKRKEESQTRRATRGGIVDRVRDNKEVLKRAEEARECRRKLGTKGETNLFWRMGG